MNMFLRILFVSIVAQTVHCHELASQAAVKDGAIVGSLMGFGAGHALQDRYLEKGLIFTIGDSIGLAAVGAGLGWMLAPMPRHKTYQEIDFSDLSTGGFSMMLIGACLLTAFRICEIVDLWSFHRSETRIIKN